MSVMNMIEALNSAHRVMMARDPDIVVFGEDIGYFGGVFRVTAGLQKEFGTSRVFDAPIAEGGIVAAGIGMGLYGLKPVIEIQFADYIFPGFDQIFSEAGRIRYRTAGEWSVPRSEEHTSELQSRRDLVCRLLLEKKKKKNIKKTIQKKKNNKLKTIYKHKHKIKKRTHSIIQFMHSTRLKLKLPTIQCQCMHAIII